MSAAWSEKHWQEASAATGRLIEECAIADDLGAVNVLASGLRGSASEEAAWRRLLARVGFDAGRIDREVRRVRDLAEGHKVRKKSERWEAMWPPARGREGPHTREQAHRRAKAFDGGIVVHTVSRRIVRAG